MNDQLISKLEKLSRDDLYELLKKAGITWPDNKKDDITKEQLLLVADEADMEVLKKELAML